MLVGMGMGIVIRIFAVTYAYIVFAAFWMLVMCFGGC